MGRTRRKRIKRKHFQSLDYILEVIDLRRWLSKNGWLNEANLQLRDFSETGRGVTSSKPVKENDIIITVPYNLMITYTTLQTNLQEAIFPDGKLKMHDLLTVFLVLEKCKEKSLWSEYINSLPKDLPSLPWLATSAELNLYPLDLHIISRKKRYDFEESMYRARRSIKKHPDCVLDENLFKWGYVLVNTRAVYVDPRFVYNVTGDFLGRVLMDEPSMALCPFLDMFNYHFLAKTEAKVIHKEGRWVYQLKTLSNSAKFEQIFISYGSHDNIKLLMEYGFFMKGNIFDTVKFNLEEILKIFGIALGGRQYKFLKNHDFDKNNGLYIGYEGVSFNLKAVLFVICNDRFRDYNSVIFSDSYPDDFLEDLPMCLHKLMYYKLEVFRTDLEKLESCDFVKTDHALLMENFLKYRLDFVQELIRCLCDGVTCAVTRSAVK